MSRPLIAAGAAFLLGALAGTLALLLFIPALLLWRRAAAVALFGIAGVLTAVTAPESAPILARGEWLLEASIAEQDEDRIAIDLIGAAPVGTPLAPVQGRILGFGASAPCELGDRARLLVRARTVAPYGFPGERADPTHTIAIVERCLPLERSVLLPIDRLRQRMRAAIDRALPAERAAVIRAMALGDGIASQPALRRDFADSGLAHLLAVSGQHLVVVAALFTVILAALFARIASVRDRWGTRRPAALAALVLILLYTLLVGAPPSAVRAAIMVGVMLAGRLIDRRREAWSALALAFVAMVAVDPRALSSLSFQLSFAAVAGLLLIDRPLADRIALSRWPRAFAPIGALLVTSFAATLGTAPLIADRFGRVSLIGLFANVPAEPLVTLFLLPAALAASLVGAISETIGGPLLAIAGWGAEALIRLARASAEAPGATLAATALEALIFGAMIVLWIFGRSRLAIVAALAIAVAVASDRWPEPNGGLVLTALPVGQGTAILIETPEGARILVDTGPPDTAERVLLPYLLHRRIDRLDLVVLSHPHADHTGGFELLAHRMQIDRVWINGDRREALPDLSRQRTIVVTATTVGLGGAQIEVLHSEPDAARVNDGSIVLRVSYGSRRLLLAGDAERVAETAMLARGRDLSADVLVVGHHGSASSSSDAFLDAVRPSIAIVPVGRDNSFHHPHPSVMARFESRGVRVFRTDRDGAVRIQTDGDAICAAAFVRPCLVRARECCFPSGTL